MTTYSLRLPPGTELVSELIRFVAANKMKAASIATCVGGLEFAQLRMAGASEHKQDIRDYHGHFEIVSLVGTVTHNGCHLHMSMSDQEGLVFGGHLKKALVNPVAEIVIIDDESSTYSREFDPQSGFLELVIKKR